MTLEQINERIEQLEQAQQTRNSALAIKRIELATKQAEVNELQQQISAEMFEHTSQYQELQDLRIAKRVLEG